MSPISPTFGTFTLKSQAPSPARMLLNTISENDMMNTKSKTLQRLNSAFSPKEYEDFATDCRESIFNTESNTNVDGTGGI